MADILTAKIRVEYDERLAQMMAKAKIKNRKIRLAYCWKRRRKMRW